MSRRSLLSPLVDLFFGLFLLDVRQVDQVYEYFVFLLRLFSQCGTELQNKVTLFLTGVIPSFVSFEQFENRVNS